MKNNLKNLKEYSLNPLNEIELYETIGGDDSLFKKAGRMAGQAARAVVNFYTITDGGLGCSYDYDAAAMGPIA